MDSKILCATCGTCTKWNPDQKKYGQEGQCRNFFSPMHLRRMSPEESCERWCLDEEVIDGIMVASFEE